MKDWLWVFLLLFFIGGAGHQPPAPPKLDVDIIHSVSGKHYVCVEDKDYFVLNDNQLEHIEQWYRKNNFGK